MELGEIFKDKTGAIRGGRGMKKFKIRPDVLYACSLKCSNFRVREEIFFHQIFHN